MAFRKHAITTVALLCLSGLLIGCSSDNTPTTPTITAEAPMLPPTNVTFNNLSNGAVSISWDANTQSHLKGYNVYRAVASGNAIGKINPSLLTATSYVDNSVDGHSVYKYWVSSVSAKNAESAMSTPITFYSRTGNSKRDRENDL